MRALENFVPAVLGYRWAVSDEGACLFARAFYEALFDRSNTSHKFIEYAFLAARKAVYGRAASDPTWASATLVMQLSDP
jgi:hypothetical protein